MSTKQERLESAASDMGFDDASDMLTLLGMNSLCVITKEERGEFERLTATLDKVRGWLEEPGRDEGERMFVELRAILSTAGATDAKLPRVWDLDVEAREFMADGAVGDRVKWTQQAAPSEPKDKP